jgi:hypothetical protein
MDESTFPPQPIPREWRMAAIAFPILLALGIVLNVAGLVLYPDGPPPCRHRQWVLLTVWDWREDCLQTYPQPPAVDPPRPGDRLALNCSD